jgi:cobalt-zinc-cadmium efflux system outer membrane protein
MREFLFMELMRAVIDSTGWRRSTWIFCPVLIALAGCVHTPVVQDRNSISQRVEERMGYPVGPHAIPDKIVLPAGIESGRKLSEDEVVLLALWNNPLFLETLVELQLTRADLIQAKLLPNPEALYYFAAPEKAYRYLVDFPIESLWLRPIRIRNAQWENTRAAERLTQAALDLIRDTRQAYADLLLARERIKIAQEAVRIRGAMGDLAAARLKAGDASVQEAATAKIDATQAIQDAARIGYELPLAEERLRNLMGLSGLKQPIAVEDASAFQVQKVDLAVEELTDEAMRSRPDFLAADRAVIAAAERVRLAKRIWFRFLGIADATGGHKTGHEFGPAARMTLPIFNWNQGGVARATAELEQLERRRVTVQNQIAFDVRQAHVRYSQASAELEIIRQRLKPEVEANIKRAEKTYKDGGAPYVLVLETTRQLIDTNNREAQLIADLRRAWADLERSVGRRLNAIGQSPRKDSSP